MTTSGTADATVIVSDAKGDVLATDLGDGKRRIRLEPKDPDAYLSRRSIDTTYDDRLIQAICTAKGYPNVCDEIARDQDPHYLERHLTATVTAHLDPAELAGARILDFGCGAGASTSILARLLPESTIVAVELEDSFLDVARERARFYGLTNIEFQHSPSGDKLPDGLGQFEVVILSAVFEHLLPNERTHLMPVIWSAVKPGGYLVIDETPWRWFPIETHTTGLPLLNYLPRSAAQKLAARKPKLAGRTSWPDLLRAGIRGGTVREIVRSVGAPTGGARIVAPSRTGIDNYVDLWFEGYARSGTAKHGGLKRSAHGVLRAVERTTGLAAVPFLSLVLEKTA